MSTTSRRADRDRSTAGTHPRRVRRRRQHRRRRRSDERRRRGERTVGRRDGRLTARPALRIDGDSQRFVEDEVAACMRDRGWEYEPNTAGSMVMSVGGRGADTEFREQYGYGISTRPPLDSMPGGRRRRPTTRTPTTSRRCRRADRERYFTDLTGMAPFDASEDGDAAAGQVIEAIDIDPNSCFAIAQQAAAVEHPELSEEFGKRLGELLQGIDDEPAMVEALAAWSACMTEAGYPYDGPEEIFTDLSQRYSQITGQEQPAGAGGGATTARVVVIIVGGLDGEELDLSPADEERLGRLQAEEVEIARADVDVRGRAPRRRAIAARAGRADVLRSEYPGLGAEA